MAHGRGDAASAAPRGRDAKCRNGPGLQAASDELPKNAHPGVILVVVLNGRWGEKGAEQEEEEDGGCAGEEA
eukprot:7279630-Pyramimonas_sp.AAC.1